MKKRERKEKNQHHTEFPSGHPSKYYPCPALLNFRDRARTSVFNAVWTLVENSVLLSEFYVSLF